MKEAIYEMVKETTTLIKTYVPTAAYQTSDSKKELNVEVSCRKHLYDGNLFHISCKH